MDVNENSPGEYVSCLTKTHKKNAYSEVQTDNFISNNKETVVDVGEKKCVPRKRNCIVR